MIRHTPVLAGDEVDPITKLDLEAAVAHEVLEADSGDDPSSGSRGVPSRLREDPRIAHGGCCPRNPLDGPRQENDAGEGRQRETKRRGKDGKREERGKSAKAGVRRNHGFLKALEKMGLAI